MPVNRNALIRYRTIDKCLQNNYRKWTLNDLIEECSEALYEFEGIDKGVSKRTIQKDIQDMRSDKLGYNAPIIVVDKKFYTYEDKDYSITNIPLNNQDLDVLHEVVGMLNQFKGFSHFQEVTTIIKRIESKIQNFSNEAPYVIDFEKNEQLKGLEFLDPLHQAILKKEVLSIDYLPFKRRKIKPIILHPYLLKEYRNRWFVLGHEEMSKRIMILALDRIRSFHPSLEHHYTENTFFSPHTYFDNVIGVSVSKDAKIEKVIFVSDYENAPYLLTKPIHPSQRIIKKDEEGVHIQILVQINYELERELLGLAERIRVISPEPLVRSIQERLAKGIKRYLT